MARTVSLFVVALTLASSVACRPGHFFEAEGHVVDARGDDVAGLTVSCLALRVQDGAIESIDDVDFAGAVGATTDAFGRYMCGDVPTDLLAPDPWGGRETRDLALSFVDEDDAANGGRFAPLALFVLAIESGETRQVDVTLADAASTD